jgi:hypothetical protein
MKGYRIKVVKEVVTIYHKHNSGSIGLSENAKVGYKNYYKNHKIDFIKNKLYYLYIKKAIVFLWK